MPTYQPITDPFPGKGPIPTNTPNFYDRIELLTNVKSSLLADNSVSLVGERKAGKTSFLNHLLANLPSDEFIPVYIDAQSVAPPKDKIFLGRLIRDAFRTIKEVVNLSEVIEINTFTASSDEVYLTFDDDLERLRAKLPLNSNGQKKRLIWLVDEIEILRNYPETHLFTVLRPLAQTDPDFRLVLAGYDVLYTLSNLSEWSPFFNAFEPIRLEGFNPVVAQQLIDDALLKMGTPQGEDWNLYQPIFQWTGRKPFYLKWILSTISESLNQRQTNYQIDSGILQDAQTLFLNKLTPDFNHLWNHHTTPSQRTVLSLIAAQAGPYNRPTILNDLKQKQLIQGDKQATQHLIEYLTRLEQLGFLYKQVGEYTFSSGCLKQWIKANKPLG